MKNVLTIAFCFSILAATFFSQPAYSSVGVFKYLDEQQAERDAREAAEEAAEEADEDKYEYEYEDEYEDEY